MFRSDEVKVGRSLWMVNRAGSFGASRIYSLSIMCRLATHRHPSLISQPTRSSPICAHPGVIC